MEQLNQSHVWHPYTPGISGNEICIDRAEGEFLYTKDGRKILDCISSWWVNTHGHAHPYIAEAIGKQAHKLEQVIFAGFTHEPAENLANRLLPFLPGKMDKVFYSDNGSTAVEVAIKMALQFFHFQNSPRRRIVALRNAYHGDTFGAMAVGERGPFSAAFKDHLFDVSFIDPPYSHYQEGTSAPDLSSHLEQAKEILSQPDVAAIIVEPLLQGAGGMLMYPEEWLESVFEIASELGVLTIADEVFTGFYRTGKPFATSGLRISPDIICLSKGLTAGFLPTGITVANEKVVKPFQENSYARTFYHGHSFTANPLACAAAIASLDLIEESGFPEKVALIAELQRIFARKVHAEYPMLEARHLGTVFALTLKAADGLDYTHPLRHKIYAWFMEKDILLRPIGNVMYMVPPYCMESHELEKVHDAILEFLEEIHRG